jgi:hypothetical protein
VFPSDTQIPVPAIARYWARTHSRTAEQSVSDLGLLAAANVLRLDRDAVGFHDLQHDYLLLHAPTLALLHAELLHAYRTLLSANDPEERWCLPVGELYIWDHLTQHLRGAGECRMLAATVARREKERHVGMLLRERAKTARRLCDSSRAGRLVGRGLAWPVWYSR